jgi:flavin reductase (DIM6/NTAB) family NADH-FMN oxidoreductase RutF
MAGERFGTKEFRRVCARFATGVAIATVLEADGTPHGMTVNSFTSVSLEPPLVLIAIDHACNILPLFHASNSYGLSVLAHDQEALSTLFATKGEDRFDGIAWNPGETGVPLIPGSIAHFECLVRQVIEAGDHTVFVAEVIAAAHHGGEPLVFFDSVYARLERGKE